MSALKLSVVGMVSHMPLGVLARKHDSRKMFSLIWRAIERFVVFPLANLVATGQVKLGDFIRIDIGGDGNMTFTKEAEGALVPVLLEKYGPEFTTAAAAKASRGAGSRREANASNLLDK